MRNKLGKQYARRGRYKGGKYAYALRGDRENIHATIDADVFDKLLAMSYLMNADGVIAPLIRTILSKGINNMIAELVPEERKLLEERILPNVQTNNEILRKGRRERMAQKNKELRQFGEDDSTRIYEDDFPLTEEDEIPAP